MASANLVFSFSIFFIFGSVGKSCLKHSVMVVAEKELLDFSGQVQITEKKPVSLKDLLT